MARPVVKREADAYLREYFQMSKRRIRNVLVANRKMIRYKSRRPPATVRRERPRDLCQRTPNV
jgi:hypothetical protein